MTDEIKLPLSDSSLRQIALFAAFSMFCATLEYLFPRPVPFFRLGLANLPIILALPLMDLRSLTLLTLLKVLGQGLINGTLASYVFLFSLAGSFASFFLMYLLHRFMRLSYVGISLAGALASNTVQSLFSVLFIFGRQAWVILPIFYGLGLAAGLVIGFLAEKISRNSRWFHARYTEAMVEQRLSLCAGHIDGNAAGDLADDDMTDDSLADVSANRQLAADEGSSGERTGKAGQEWLRSTVRPAFLQKHLSTPGACIAGALALPLFLLVEHPLPRLVQVIILGLLALAAGKRLLYGYFFFLIISVTFFHLLIPQGRVLASIGQFAITEGALFSGLYRGLSIIGLVFISLFSIRRDLILPGILGRLIGTTLGYFEQIYQYRKSASLGRFVQRLDMVLYDLDGLQERSAGQRPKLRLSDLPVILLIVGLMSIVLFYDTSLI